MLAVSSSRGALAAGAAALRLLRRLAHQHAVGQAVGHPGDAADDPVVGAAELGTEAVLAVDVGGALDRQAGSMTCFRRSATTLFGV